MFSNPAWRKLGWLRKEGRPEFVYVDPPFNTLFLIINLENVTTTDILTIFKSVKLWAPNSFMISITTKTGWTVSSPLATGVGPENGCNAWEIYTSNCISRAFFALHLLMPKVRFLFMKWTLLPSRSGEGCLSSGPKLWISFKIESKKSL